MALQHGMTAGAVHLSLPPAVPSSSFVLLPPSACAPDPLRRPSPTRPGSVELARKRPRSRLARRLVGGPNGQGAQPVNDVGRLAHTLRRPAGAHGEARHTPRWLRGLRSFVSQLST